MDAIEFVLGIITYLLFLAILMGTIVGGFINVALAVKVIGSLFPWFIVFFSLLIAIKLLPFIQVFFQLVAKIALDGCLILFSNLFTFLGSIVSFFVGLGDAAQAYFYANLSIGIDFIVNIFGAGNLFIVNIFDTGNLFVVIIFRTIGTLLYAVSITLQVITYIFGSAVLILLNLLAFWLSWTLNQINTPDVIQIVVIGTIIMIALPLTVKLVLQTFAGLVYIISIAVVKVSAPIWKTSWVGGWIVKMLLACVMLVAYIEKNIKERSLTLNWDGKNWTLAQA